jgi:glycosyltransferase involved in cell wall biosynthesis
VRILHVVTLVDDASSYGGPLTVAVNQCRELRRRGHDARILAGWKGNGAPPTEIEAVPAHLFPVRTVIPGMRFSGLFSAPMVAWLHRNARTFDVAHLHFARDLVPLSAGAVLRRARLPYVTQTHGMVVPDRRPHARAIDAALTLRLLRDARTRFALTDAEATAMDALLGATRTTERLHNGVEIPDTARQETDPPDVLFMARLHPRKRVMDFAEAARTLLEEGHDATFSIVGSDDGDLPKLLQFLAANPTLKGRLRYEGALPHTEALKRLQRAGIYTLPSVDEPFPMTLLEALAHGVPSICTNSCGIAADLRRHGAALVVRPGATDIAAAERRLLANAHERARLSAAGPSAVAAEFGATVVGDRLLTSYGRRAGVAA